MSLQVVYLSSQFLDVLSISVSILIKLSLDLVDLLNKLFEVFYEPVHALLVLEVGLIDYIDEHLAVVSDGSSQSFQVRVHELGELVYALVQHLEVGHHGLLHRILDLFDLCQGSGFVTLEQFVEFGAVNWQMAFYDLKSFVYIFFHILVVDQVLFELLGQLGTQGLDRLNLLGDARANLYHLFVDVATQEVSAFGVVLLGLSHLLLQICNKGFS